MTDPFHVPLVTVPRADVLDTIKSLVEATPEIVRAVVEAKEIFDCPVFGLNQNSEVVVEKEPIVTISVSFRE
jgi:hypothetical protein